MYFNESDSSQSIRNSGNSAKLFRPHIIQQNYYDDMHSSHNKSSLNDILSRSLKFSSEELLKILNYKDYDVDME
jgi:hypothetical protein